ncbi:MAG: hypothetical protein ACREDF_09745 [Thermoplasmata archaeon]
MARRKRKEEDADWVAPEFDEVKYMRKEIEAGRAALATVGWAILGAVVSFLLYSVNPGLAFFAGIGLGFGMYIVLPLTGINIEPFKRKDWFSHGATYFFSWLAVWILLLNPPFGDFTNPTIQAISVSPSHIGYNGTLTCVGFTGGPVPIDLNSPNNSVYILFRASDNVGIADVSVQVSPLGFVTPYLQSGNDSKCSGQPGKYLGGTYNATFTVALASTYVVTISARDARGLDAVVGFEIRIM